MLRKLKNGRVEKGNNYIILVIMASLLKEILVKMIRCAIIPFVVLKISN